MTVGKREALVAKGAIVLAWSLFALTIGVGLQAGGNAHEQPVSEPAKTEATHQP